MAPWRKPLATHDTGKVVLDLDLAIALTLGQGCLADVAALRAELGVTGWSSRTRPCHARSRRWPLTPAVPSPRSTPRDRGPARRRRHSQVTGPRASASTPGPLVIDVDATLVTAHSGKEQPRDEQPAGHLEPSLARHRSCRQSINRREPGDVVASPDPLTGSPSCRSTLRTTATSHARFSRAAMSASLADPILLAYRMTYAVRRWSR